MSICSICGCNASPEAKFCPKCGAALRSENNNQNENGFIGMIHKCPNCGETIGAFQTKCPTCGIEFRNAEVAQSVKEFAERVVWLQQNKAADQVVSFIRNYAVPNTKEDIVEFMILASSNIDIGLYSLKLKSVPIKERKMVRSRLLISEAWISKMEQVYHKATISLGDDPETQRVKDIYEAKISEVNRIKGEVKKKATNKKIVIIVICIIVVSLLLSPCILGMLSVVAMGIKDAVAEASLTPEEKYERDLENELSRVRTEINIGEYDEAMIRVMSLKYDQFDNPEKEKEWDEKREYLIAEIEKKQEQEKREQEEARRIEEEKTPEEKYEEELEKEYQDIWDYISWEEYDTAMKMALDLRYDKFDDEEKKKEWDEKREYLIEYIKNKQGNNSEENAEE